MTDTRLPARSLEGSLGPATGVAVADAPEGLSAIHSPGCAAAIWRRAPLQSFQNWIDQLEVERLPRARMITQPSGVQGVVRKSCDIVGTPNCTERALLVDDIAALAHIFAEIVGAPYLRLRLDVVTTDACRKFHIDEVASRLICTYRGTGTQYGVVSDGADPRRVFTTPTGAPIVLRGTHWPEDVPPGLRHRSPPIAGTGETRLLLVIDPLDVMIDEPTRQLH